MRLATMENTGLAFDNQSKCYHFNIPCPKLRALKCHGQALEQLPKIFAMTNDDDNYWRATDWNTNNASTKNNFSISWFILFICTHISWWKKILNWLLINCFYFNILETQKTQSTIFVPIYILNPFSHQFILLTSRNTTHIGMTDIATFLNSKFDSHRA